MLRHCYQQVKQETVAKVGKCVADVPPIVSKWANGWQATLAIVRTIGARLMMARNGRAHQSSETIIYRFSTRVQATT